MRIIDNMTTSEQDDLFQAIEDLAQLQEGLLEVENQYAEMLHGQAMLWEEIHTYDPSVRFKDGMWSAKDIPPTVHLADLRERLHDRGSSRETLGENMTKANLEKGLRNHYRIVDLEQKMQSYSDLCDRAEQLEIELNDIDQRITDLHHELDKDLGDLYPDAIFVPPSPRGWRIYAGNDLIEGGTPSQLIENLQRLLDSVTESTTDPTTDPIADTVADTSTINCSTLGELIAAVESCPDTAMFRGFGEPHSWRGVYSELAIEPKGISSKKALLDRLNSCIGQDLQGYKGGWFTMGRDTRVWMDHYGNCTDTKLTGISIDSNGFVTPVTEP